MPIKTIFEIGAKDSTSKELKKAQKNFRQLEKDGASAGDAVADSFKRLAGPLLAAVSAAQGLRKLVAVTREFDILNAGLITATGSAENAAMAFEAIQNFAAETPYNLQQVTDGFIKLKNLGLDPSESSLTSYGNTAAAMGKSLDQMIEAVADATTGEFERLKEFGIRSKSEGDRVSFTFRGVTTTIGKNSAEIQNYLTQLGQNEFAGAMSERMNTLDGAISNLEDSWDKLFLNISQQGAGDLITEGVRTATAAIEELSELIKSPVIPNIIDSWTVSFDGFGEDVSESASIIGDVFDSLFEKIGFGGVDVASGLTVTFGTTLANIRSAVQLATVEMASFFDELAVESGSLSATLAGDAYLLLDAVGLGGTELAENMRKTWADAYTGPDGIQGQINAIEAVRLSSIDAILEENEASKNALYDQINLTEKTIESYKRLRSAKQLGGDTDNGDALGAFGSRTVEPASVEEDPEVVAAQARINYLKTLKDAQLASEEESEELAFLRRMEMLRTRFEEGEIPTLESYNRLKEGVEQRHQENLTAIVDEWAAKRAAFEKMSLKDQAKTTFSTLSGITAGVAQHNKGLFELNKAAGIGNAIINTYEGVSESLSAYPMPLAAVFAASHLAAGLAQVAAIKKTTFGSKNQGATSVGGASVTTAPSNISQLPAAQNNQQVQQVTNVSINLDPDEVYSGRTVRKLMEKIEEQSGNLNVSFG